jgi:hypothetical protein
MGSKNSIIDWITYGIGGLLSAKLPNAFKRYYSSGTLNTVFY